MCKIYVLIQVLNKQQATTTIIPHFPSVVWNGWQCSHLCCLLKKVGGTFCRFVRLFLTFPYRPSPVILSKSGTLSHTHHTSHTLAHVTTDNLLSWTDGPWVISLMWIIIPKCGQCPVFWTQCIQCSDSILDLMDFMVSVYLWFVIYAYTHPCVPCVIYFLVLLRVCATCFTYGSNSTPSGGGWNSNSCALQASPPSHPNPNTYIVFFVIHVCVCVCVYI